jgi:hypothetical protein
MTRPDGGDLAAVHLRFSAQARRTPDATAVEDGPRG